MQVVAIALEELVRLHLEHDVEIAGRSAELAGVAFAAVANARVVFHARRHLHHDLVLARDARFAVARLAWRCG